MGESSNSIVVSDPVPKASAPVVILAPPYTDVAATPSMKTTSETTTRRKQPKKSPCYQLLHCFHKHVRPSRHPRHPRHLTSMQATWPDQVRSVCKYPVQQGKVPMQSQCVIVVSLPEAEFITAQVRLGHDL
ncbi:unnamed protein product [Echinostoma caproni]|uniref:Uncharacterized protein n=1 Tax=Echinostoma caproni TaxID=27848 RepID=A0A183AH66_9TREM|nr:unnamed protein product [Echinostoma caproni]